MLFAVHSDMLYPKRRLSNLVQCSVQFALRGYKSSISLRMIITNSSWQWATSGKREKNWQYAKQLSTRGVLGSNGMQLDVKLAMFLCCLFKERKPRDSGFAIHCLFLVTCCPKCVWNISGRFLNITPLSHITKICQGNNTVDDQQKN